MSKLSRTGLQYLSKNKHNFAISRNVLRYVLTIHFFSYWFLWRNCNQFFDNCVFKTALQSFIEKTLITKWNSCLCSLQACFSVLFIAKKKKNAFNFFLQPTVSADVLERYIALEEKIAAAEKDSPAMLLQQKQEQIQQLSIRIEEQKELVDQLSAQA